jgi:hypothetical protein
MPSRPRRLRHSPISLTGLQVGDARIAIVAAQPPGFGEFGGGVFGLALEGIGGGEAGANERIFRIGVARLFEPEGIASSVRDCSRCTRPIWKYHTPMAGSRGLSRVACSTSGIVSSIDPVWSLHWPRLCNTDVRIFSEGHV